MTVISLCTDSGVRGGVDRPSPKGGDARRSGPPGNFSVGSVTHHPTDSLPLQTSWLPQSFTSQAPIRVRSWLATGPPPPRQEGQPWRGCCCCSSCSRRDHEGTCQQSPMNCARGPSMAKNSSPWRAPKNELSGVTQQAGRSTTKRSAKNGCKTSKNPLIADSPAINTDIRTAFTASSTSRKVAA